MAALSPAISNSSNDTSTAGGASAASGFSTATASSLHRSDPPKNLRGLNKPKCIKCGNVARSRCPYQSCKSCCAKAQNPCYIHVLKSAATLTDKPPTSTSPLFDQKSTDTTPPGTQHRVSSLRQLSNNFAQFNNLQLPLRSRRPLTRKDAVAINDWRFSKLKEFRERNIEVENEAFDRYMHNVSLLEEIFSPKSRPEELGEEALTFEIKLKLRSNTIKSENFKKRVQEIVDHGLRNLKKRELNNTITDSFDQNENKKTANEEKSLRVERVSAYSDLIDKLNKARNTEDLKSCLEIQAQLFNKTISESKDELSDTETGHESSYTFPKMLKTVEVDEETLSSLDADGASLVQMVET